MQSITIDTSSRSSTSASKATSAGSVPSGIAELRQRPARPVRVARRPGDADPVPAGVAADVLPARDPALDLGPDPVADVEVAERRDARLDAETEQRRRQDRRERRRRRRVRVLVGPDVEAVRASTLEHGDRLGRPALDRARRALEVRHLEPRRDDACVGGGAHGPDRLVERLEQAVGLVAQVRGVQAAPPGRGRGEGSHLRRVRMQARRVDQARTTARSHRRPWPPRPHGPSPRAPVPWPPDPRRP